MPGMSVMQAITMSGGFGRFAAKSRIQIHRKVEGPMSRYYFSTIAIFYRAVIQQAT